MATLDENVERWLDEIFTTKLPKKAWDDWMFDPKIRKMLDRRTRQEHPYVYISVNRPLSYVWAKSLDPDSTIIVTPSSGIKSYVASRELLAPEILYELELYPLLETRVQTFMSLFSADEFPKSFAKLSPDGDVRLAVVGGDPRNPGKWRASYFEENVGPTGHSEASTLAEALKLAFENGYWKIADDSLLDDVAATFPNQTAS